MSIMRVSMALTQAATYSVSAVAAVLLVLAVCLAGCSRSSGGAPVPAGVSLSVSGPSTLATEPGARSVLLLSMRIRGLAKDTRVESLSLQIHFPKGAPRPLAQLQLFMDVNADGVQDPLVDMAMAQLVLSEDGRVAKVALDRRFSRGQEERWLIVGNVRPAAMADVVSHRPRPQGPGTPRRRRSSASGRFQGDGPGTVGICCGPAVCRGYLSVGWR